MITSDDAVIFLLLHKHTLIPWLLTVIDSGLHNKLCKYLHNYKLNEMTCNDPFWFKRTKGAVPKKINVQLLVIRTRADCIHFHDDFDEIYTGKYNLQLISYRCKYNKLISYRLLQCLQSERLKLVLAKFYHPCINISQRVE